MSKKIVSRPDKSTGVAGPGESGASGVDSNDDQDDWREWCRRVGVWGVIDNAANSSVGKVVGTA